MDALTPLSPTARTLEQLVRLLTAAGQPSITAAQVEADLAAGAPTNADGTVNIVHYAAWLVQEMGRGRD